MGGSKVWTSVVKWKSHTDIHRNPTTGLRRQLFCKCVLLSDVGRGAWEMEVSGRQQQWPRNAPGPGDHRLHSKLVGKPRFLKILCGNYLKHSHLSGLDAVDLGTWFLLSPNPSPQMPTKLQTWASSFMMLVPYNCAS